MGSGLLFKAVHQVLVARMQLLVAHLGQRPYLRLSLLMQEALRLFHLNRLHLMHIPCRRAKLAA